MTVRVKRIYDEAGSDDGFRVLVDRLWPRGLTKDRARVDLWLKDVAPSAELRAWFHSPDGEFGEFGERYAAELDGNPAVAELHAIVGREPVVTLLYGAKAAADRNHAALLADRLAQM